MREPFTLLAADCTLVGRLLQQLRRSSSEARDLPDGPAAKTEARLIRTKSYNNNHREVLGRRSIFFPNIATSVAR